ncbi:hypothetical protein ASC77_08885 [Nocardioides sp. Root1257]|uniref:rhamnosyltransferase WsaF family glycosyltransferase n=1 Tax=unclassified Nocardioides TaxID=2615069 RepID=UPI0006F26178|nr:MULTISPECIES: hypothetical protein [unclassified Nocardioides]KQW48833.1 hypothetical protein ASC77_08885 [Nocardioides sp. Root1257]KRC48008.1 hypothetical protein ASE24_08890 [Nocardioides sp. Root224]
MTLETPSASLSGRARQVRRLLADEGAGGIARRLRLRAAARLAPPGTRPLVVDAGDLDQAAQAAARGWTYPEPAPRAAGAPLTIAWVCTPPAPGSGGHTTMFRLVAGLESAGHRCVVYLQDQHGWSIEQHRATVRQHWPRVRADVRDFDAGVDDCDVLVATGWGTAYAVLGTTARGHRAYLVQDLEPMFSPAGSEYLLAEATYRFGFHGIAAGRWLAERLRADHGMTVDHFDFGCDLDAYGLEDRADPALRTGVAYYCRPHTPRRAHELSVFALERFARQRPDVPIHTYGEVLPTLPFAATQHGVLSPEQLSSLYNRCFAGLSLSATNVSLVPLEMLAAGCIPVVNDARHNRLVLDNAAVRYAPATPWELADALVELAAQSPADRQATARSAAASVTAASWADAEADVVAAIERLAGVDSYVGIPRG